MTETETVILAEAENLLSLLGIQGHCQVREENGCYYLDIESVDSALLIGRHGVNLDAFELILNLILAKKIKDGERVVLDIAGFRKKREEQLVSLAQKIAQKVKESGRPETVFNLKPRERRVIHLALSNNPYVETASEGEDEGRRLVIAPKKQA